MQDNKNFFGSVGDLFHTKFAMVQKDGKFCGFREKSPTEIQASMDSSAKKKAIFSIRGKVNRLQRTLASYSTRRDSMVI